MTLSLDRCCIHTFTTKPWSMDECIANYSAAGVKGITIWKETVVGLDPRQVGQQVRAAGMDVVSVARGGFFAHADAAARRAAIDDNKQLIDLCADLGAPVLVLVCGADITQDVTTNLQQIEDGIRALVPHARAQGVTLAIEPLHPKYAGDRSAVASLACANDVAERINEPEVGIAIDVYHVFWEHDLEAQIKRCGAAGNLAAFHVCDFKPDFNHTLLDRGLMGEGCIPIRQIRGWVEEAGFTGYNEVEIFSQTHWSTNQHEYLQHIITAYHSKV